MRFEWDETKDSLNQRHHGVEFSLAAQAVLDPHRLEWFDLDHSDQEDRWTIIGMAGSVAVILRVTISEREDGEVIRLISARKASPEQRRLYLSHRRRTP